MEIVVYFGMENAIVPPLVSLNPDGMNTYSNSGRNAFFDPNNSSRAKYGLNQ